MLSKLKKFVPHPRQDNKQLNMVNTRFYLEYDPYFYQWKVDL